MEIYRTQADFRKDRWTMDDIINLGGWCKKYREMNKELRICFVDYLKVFVYVKQQTMGYKFENMNFDPTLIHIISSLYSSAQAWECWTRKKGENSEQE